MSAHVVEVQAAGRHDTTGRVLLWCKTCQDFINVDGSTATGYGTPDWCSWDEATIEELQAAIEMHQQFVESEGTAP